MDKKIAGLLGAVAAFATMDAAQAASAPTQNPAEILKASSYGDLLAPIPNAVALLRAVDMAGAANAGVTEQSELSSGVQVAQYYQHHHHHHHRYGGVRRYLPPVYRPVRRYHHHHHHHRYMGY
jgi:hypothetical protein